MKFLIDTNLLLLAAAAPERLRPETRELIEASDTTRVFSAASIWEVAIKRGLGRDDFNVDPHVLRRGLLENGYEELPISGNHAAFVLSLPPIHKDPFDRMLAAQAQVEGITLLTSDKLLGNYPCPIKFA